MAEGFQSYLKGQAKKAPTVFVFRPGGVAEENVYTSFTSLYADHQATPGYKVIVFDASLGLVTIPDGTYDMSDTLLSDGDVLLDLSVLQAFGRTQVVLSDGVTIQNLHSMQNLHIIGPATTGTGQMILFNSGSTTGLLLRNCLLTRQGGGPPVVKVTGAGTVVGVVFYDSALNNSGGPLIRAENNAAISLVAESGRNSIGPNTLESDATAGTGSISYNAHSTVNATALNQPSWLGTLSTPNLVSEAVRVELDPSGMTNVTATDVQGAIAELDSAIGGGGGGGEDLAATLVLGNTTGGNNIILTAGDSITGAGAAPGTKAAGGVSRFAGGAADASPTFASGTITVTTAPLPSGSSIIIGDRFLTSTAGPRTSGSNNFDRSLGTTTALAAEIAAAINDPANQFVAAPAVTASAVGSVVTITAMLPGVAGNLISLSETSTGLTRSGDYLSGGWDGVARFAYNIIEVQSVPLGAGNIVLGGTTLSGVAGPRTSGSNNFDNTLGTLDAQAIEIAKAINDTANSFDTSPGIVAFASAAIPGFVYVFARTAGSAGNAITASETISGVGVATSFFVGGADGPQTGSILFNIGSAGSLSLTDTGANRGFQAIDLQATRAYDWQVAGSRRSAIIGGYNNAILGHYAQDAAILGGHDNTIDARTGYAYNAVILGGHHNTIRPDHHSGQYMGAHSVILGGYYNYIYKRAYGSFITGTLNYIDGGEYYAAHAAITGTSNAIRGAGVGGPGGSYHSVAMGRLNEIHGAQDSFALGRFNYVGGPSPAYGSCSLAGGNSNTVRSYHTFVWGRSHSTHTRAAQSAALGGATYLYVPGQFAHSSFTGGGAGTAQASHYTLIRTTTNATPTELTPTSFSPSTTNRLFIRPSHSYAFRMEIAARQTGGSAGTVGDSAMWTITGLIKRDGSNNTVLVGVTGTGTPLMSDAGAVTWSVAVTADDTNETLLVSVTGETNKTIRWVAHIYDAEA